MNVPRITTAQTSPAAAVMRGFIAPVVGAPSPRARSPFRGEGCTPALEPGDSALELAGGEDGHFRVRKHVHAAGGIAARDGAEQVGDRQRMQDREDDALAL